jgi:hypothetical protein
MFREVKIHVYIIGYIDIRKVSRALKLEGDFTPDGRDMKDQGMM